MTAPVQQFLGSRLKVKRANGHIQNLHAAFRTFVQSDFYRLIFKYDEQADYTSFQIDRTQSLPPDLSLPLGDTVHNLRTAFDHIITAYTGMEDAFISFPTHEKRDDVIRGRSYRAIKKTFPDFADFIVDTIQPYRGGAFQIWELSKLDNIDKHKLLIPVLSIFGLRGVDYETEGGGRVSDNAFQIVGERLQPSIRTGGKVTKIHSHGQAAADMLFGPGTPVQNQRVIPTLTRMAEHTLKAIEALEAFCFGNVANPNAVKF